MKNKNGAAYPPEYEAADVSAIQQLERGEADAAMQKRALAWIIDNAAKTYDLSYRPGDPHETTFAEGRRFVGSLIIKMLKLDPKKVANANKTRRERK